MLKKVNFDDKALHAGLVKIVEGGTYDIKGSEVELFARIMIWLKIEVPQMIEDKKKGKQVITED